MNEVLQTIFDRRSIRAYQDAPVPEVLLTGNHANINQWRDAQSLERTRRKRPDLLQK